MGYLFHPLRQLWHLTGAQNSPTARLWLSRLAVPAVALLSRLKQMNFGEHCDGFTRLCYLMQWYEQETVSICHRYIQPGMRVMDLGAHLGYFSILFAKLIGPTGRVYAFEPHQDTYNLLCKNVKRYPNVVPVQKAVAERGGKLDFFEMTASGQHSLYHISRPDTGALLKRKVVVESTTVDDFLEELGNPEIHFVKIDIEGAETAALRGMANTIKRVKRLVMIIEYSPVSLKMIYPKPADFLEYIRSFGLEVQTMGFSMAELQKSHPQGWHINLLCVKRD